jgi:hypothetical protein
MGGYAAACALRAAGEASSQPVPASFSCHYLGVAQFEPIDIEVEAQREGRAATSQRVEVTQSGRRILDAMVWSTSEGPGLEHNETVPPDVPRPDDLPGHPSDSVRPYPFWDNLESRIIHFEPVWPPTGPRPAVWQEWLRFIPTATFADPWVDAARLLILVDLPSWPSAHRAHAWFQPAFMPQPWTSMLRFTNRLRATSGCYVTGRRHSLPAGSSAGLPASGPRNRGSSLPAEVSACTGHCHPTRVRSGNSASWSLLSRSDPPLTWGDRIRRPIPADPANRPPGSSRSSPGPSRLP